LQPSSSGQSIPVGFRALFVLSPAGQEPLHVNLAVKFQTEELTVSAWIQLKSPGLKNSRHIDYESEPTAFLQAACEYQVQRIVQVALCSRSMESAGEKLNISHAT